MAAVKTSGDSHAIARCRVQMKLAALAYVGTRHGVDACEAFTGDGMMALASAAFAYVGALTGRSIGFAPQPIAGSDKARHAAFQLGMGALAYDKARHGSDGTIEFVRAALALLCQCAVNFVEVCLGESMNIDPKALDV